MKPKAVLISDVHYSLQTLEVADAAMRQAIRIANDLEVPLIVAGDLHDTKANLRAESVNRMLETFNLCETQCFILVGNHDKVNEKSIDHALNFLRSKAQVIDRPQFTNDFILSGMSVHLIPYQHDLVALRAYLKTVDKGSTIIMHQGIAGSHSGDYIQDKTAITHEDVSDFRVISGHYHQRQDIQTGEKGRWSYIGNPYTLNYAEAKDPSKGFQILMSDGSLEHVTTNLREHKVFEFDLSKPLLRPTNITALVKENDLVWIKIKGPSDELAKLTKAEVTNLVGIKQSFRLDFIPIDADVSISEEAAQESGQEDVFDQLIDSLSNTDNERKARLKVLWKEFVTKE